MLNYQLSYFERLIRHDLLIRHDNQDSLDSDFFSAAVTAAHTEKDRILLSFTEHLFKLNNEQTVEWYIQSHQNEIVHLMNLREEYMTPEDQARPQDSHYYKLCKSTYLSLLEIS